MTIMQIFAFASTAVLHIFLARKLGPAEYGVAGIIISALVVVRAGVFGSAMMGTSKLIAARPECVTSCIAISKRAYAGIAAFIALQFFFFAPQFASYLRDPSLTGYIRLLPIAVAPLGAYVLLLSILTGLKDFRSTMLVGILFQILKLTLIVGMVLMGLGVPSLIFGFGLASLLAFLIFRKRAKLPRGTEALPLLDYLKTMIGVFIALTLAIVLRYANFWNLKRIVSDSIVVGHYTAASQLALIPALIFSGFVVALWPAVSGESGASDITVAREHIAKSFKYLLLALLPFTAILAALPDYTILMAYGKQYLPASRVLPLLLVAIAVLATQSLIMSACLALGKTWPIVATLLAAIVGIVLIGNVLIPRYGILGAAAAEVTGFSLSGLVFGALTFRTFGRFTSFAQGLKICASSVFLFIVVHSFAFLGRGIVLVVPIAFGLYLLTVRLLGVLDDNEIREGLALARVFIANANKTLRATFRRMANSQSPVDTRR